MNLRQYHHYHTHRSQSQSQMYHAPSTPVSLSPQEKDKSLQTTITIFVPTILVVVVLLIFISIYFRRKKARKILLFGRYDEDNDEIKTVESLQFNLDTIQVATSNFSAFNKLGKGGVIYFLGKLSNGQVIAIKRLLQHRNLVRLLGFSLAGREKLLVYEFVPNKSLDYFIFDPTKKAQLDWEKRYKIIRGIARGLLYLHEDSRLHIIHHDLKPNNILLNEEMILKITYFENTNRVVGTYGYMAPEYLMHGQFSVKSDVFSFGILVLEIVSGQKNYGSSLGENGEVLLSFAWTNWQEGTITNIIDPSLNNYSQNEMIRCIQIAHMLNSHSTTFPVPLKPAFFMDSETINLPNMLSQEVNSVATANKSVNEASISELCPR
ncbi:hypothetical protein AAZX31_18G218300 [Glycine max]